MSHHFDCKCEERKKPFVQRSWVVTEYMWNSGAFVRAGGEPSNWSTVRCLECGCVGRTQSNYVDKIDRMDGNDAYDEFLKRHNDRLRKVK